MEEIDAGKKICSFLEKKRVLFNQYLVITKRMKESLKNKEEGKSLVFISERQDCIKRIEGIDLSIEKIINASSDRFKHISDKLKGLIDSYISSIRSIIEAVDLIDRELMVMVQEEGESIKEELLTMRKVQQAARSYKRDTKYSPRFLDTIR